MRDWTALSALSQIESLRFPRFVCLDLDLPTEIDRVRHLTELHIGRVELHDADMNEALVGLTNLKSLGFYLPHFFGCLMFPVTDSIREMTGLTKLETDYPCLAETIRHLTNLVILRVTLGFDAGVNGCPPLNLEHLEELDVSMQFGFRGKIFSDLPSLKRLCIRDDDAEDVEFFSVLGGLHQLSHFSFVGEPTEELPLNYCLQFNILSGLRSLSMYVNRYLEPVPDPCAFLLEGSFPFLRSLHLEGFDPLSPVDCNELMRRFPCLNALSGARNEHDGMSHDSR